jgi:hypothetical protein
MLKESEKKQGLLPSRLVCGKDNIFCRSLELMDVTHKQRVYAEAFVQEIFFKAYQARLNSFYPLLLSIIGQEGNFSAVAGVRPAGGAPLFSEHYLDRPVENIVNDDRARVVEIGNLAPANAGQARWLIVIMNSFMYGAGFNHVVFTAVPKLYNAFRRMGLPLVKLVDASRECLPSQTSADWGTYYESKPAVYTGDIRVGQRALNLIASADPELASLSRRAFEVGRSFVRSVSVKPI